MAVICHNCVAKVEEMIECLSKIEALMQLTDKIEPGATRTRGILLFYKLSITAELAKRIVSGSDDWKPEEGRDSSSSLLTSDKIKFDFSLQEMDDLFEECEFILKWDFLLEDVQKVSEKWRRQKNSKKSRSQVVRNFTLNFCFYPKYRVDPRKDLVLDVSSTSSEESDLETPLTQLRSQELLEKLKKKKKKERKKKKEKKEKKEKMSEKRRHSSGSHSDDSISHHHHSKKKKKEKHKDRKREK
ncbi:hypothetical protein Anas_02088 [Armadillidium nasatum]|uniref:Uncharacterized protein n=1 Tax=Armadillidium nasatum TaxID=96803 RepID=A0A5N5TH80_9CRUS|nr:hypothetical protein Anas_02088 [Armadillidium nasatum]